jgi:hypothetical protein
MTRLRQWKVNVCDVCTMGLSHLDRACLKTTDHCSIRPIDHTTDAHKSEVTFYKSNFVSCVFKILWSRYFSHVKCTLVQALELYTGCTAHRGSRGIALLFHDDTRRVEGSASLLGCSLSPGKARYPLYKRLGGTQGRSGQVRKISSPTGFDPRTVQPIASRYNDWATRPTFIL